MINNDRQSVDELKFNCVANIFDLFDYLGLYYRVQGNILKSPCPCKDHAGDRDSQSFSINIKNGFWKCWSHNCEKKYGPDIIGLIRSVTGLKFYEALKYIQDFLSNKVLDTYKVEMPKVMGRPQKPLDESLLKFLSSGVATKFCEQRGISDTVIKRYQPGFWYRPTDFMHNRVIFPVRNEDNYLMGFSGRTIVPESDWDAHNIRAKWLHGRHYNGYPKPNEFSIGDILFNLNNVKNLTDSTVILVEGIMDGLKLSTAGINNWVCSFGNHLSKTQLSKLLKYQYTKIICFYDFDSGGNDGFQQVKELVDDKVSILRVPNIVAKKDPGDMSPRELKECINAAS